MFIVFTVKLCTQFLIIYQHDGWICKYTKQNEHKGDTESEISSHLNPFTYK